MNFAKVFRSGNSQAVRIPKEFQLTCDEVEIERRGEELVLRPVKGLGDRLFEALDAFPDDFLAEGRPAQGEQQEREGF